MIIGASIRPYSAQAPMSISSVAPAGQRSGIEVKASQPVTDDVQISPSKHDFTNMTGSQLLEAGKALAKEGKISIDEMFQIQLASGSFGEAQPKNEAKDFVEYFREQLDGEISRGGLNNSMSMVATYRNILSAMADRISYTA